MTLFRRLRPGRPPLRLESLEGRLAPATGLPALVKDINPYTAASPVANLVTAGGVTFFTVDDGTHGVELWKSDGTEAGSALVKDINPGSAGSNPRDLTNVNGTLSLTADD